MKFNYKKILMPSDFTLYSRAMKICLAYFCVMQSSSSKPNSNPVTNPVKGRENDVRDLADFHLRWPEFRNIAITILGNETLLPAERDTLKWLVTMADKIGMKDIK